MPPSGYNKNQSNSISLFLKSCSKALLSESIERSENIQFSLEREIKNIRNHLKTNGIEDIQKIILNLTLNFYKKVLSTSPKNEFEFNHYVSNICNDIEKSILEVKVVEII